MATTEGTSLRQIFDFDPRIHRVWAFEILAQLKVERAGTSRSSSFFA
jgi:hypothetical protein